MKLDVITILVTLGILCSGLSIAMLLIWRFLLPKRSLLLWGIGLGSYGAGVFLVSLRGFIPVFFTIIIGNLLIVGCYCIVWWGVSIYRGTPPWTKTILSLLIAFIALYAWFTYMDPLISARHVVLRIFIFFFVLGATLTLLKEGGLPVTFMEKATAWMFMLDGTLKLFIVAVQLLYTSYDAPLHQNMITGASAMMSLIGITSWGLAVILMMLEKTTKDLRESEERYRSLFENMLDGFAYCKMLYDEEDHPVDFIYLDVNKAFERLTGLENVIGKKVSEAIPGIRELNPELIEIYGRVALTGKTEMFEIDFKPLAKWMSVSVYSMLKGYFVAVFDDITDRKLYEKKLENFAIHDQLTGLLNRHSLEDILTRTIAKAKRGVVSSLLYMDLDNFKDVNDSVGHSTGDEVLITLAGLLKDALRTEDIVFRLGGDEFAVLLDGMTSRESLPAAERLRVSVEAHRFELAGRIFPLSLSIGLIEIGGSLATGELLSQADAAMYRAKAEGKNRVVVA